MNQSLGHIALIVGDYDEAIAWFTGVLGFTLVADEYQPEQDKRWVLVAPRGAGPDAATLLLARAASPEQEAFIGNQTGGRVFLFLKTDDFGRDYEAYRARGVRFVRPPAEHPYGKVAVFEDLYGNLWDLVEFAGPPMRRPPVGPWSALSPSPRSPPEDLRGRRRRRAPAPPPPLRL